MLPPWTNSWIPASISHYTEKCVAKEYVSENACEYILAGHSINSLTKKSTARDVLSFMLGLKETYLRTYGQLHHKRNPAYNRTEKT